jgi:hypothetical protein
VAWAGVSCATRCGESNARAFSLRHAEFLESPVDPLHRFLPMKAIASTIEDLKD